MLLHPEISLDDLSTNLIFLRRFQKRKWTFEKKSNLFSSVNIYVILQNSYFWSFSYSHNTAVLIYIATSIARFQQNRLHIFFSNANFPFLNLLKLGCWVDHHSLWKCFTFWSKFSPEFPEAHGYFSTYHLFTVVLEGGQVWRKWIHRLIAEKLFL